MRRVIALSLVVLASATGSSVLSAHHGGAAFDSTQTITFEGTVTELQFANPHVLVFFTVVKEGKTEKWSGWLTAPNKLARAGWTKRTLVPGNHITVTGTPHKQGNPILQIRRLVGPDGNALPLSEE